VIAAATTNQPDVHDLLVERVFPRQAEVLDVAAFGGLL
jgi:hypothetical protein